MVSAGRLSMVLVALVWCCGGASAREQESNAAGRESVPPLPARDGLTPTPDSAATDDLPPPRRISMDYQDANLKDVLKTFSQQTGINVIAGGNLGDQPVTLYLEDVTPIDALDQILRATNLTYERAPGSDIYLVKSKGKEEEAARMTTRVYRLKFARVSKSVLAKAAAAFGGRTPFEATLGQTGGGGGRAGGTGTSGTTGGSTTGGGAGGVGSTGGGQAGAGTTVGIDEIISALLTKDGAVVVDGRTNSLIVTDIPENFPRIEAALVALDIKTPQIMVDAELIETSLSKAKNLGIQWGTGSQGELITLTPGSRTTRFPFNVFGEGIAPSGPTPFTTATLSATSFKGVLQALESDSDTKILARPKVLTLDNESAVIRLTADEAIGFQTASQATTGTQTTTPERTTTGVVLVVTPQVNEQGYVTMVVEPSVTKTVASQITPPTGQTKPRDPKTRSSRTLVRIRNGDTLVVGGLIDRSDQDTLTYVPILSGIPFLGEAFKKKEVNDQSSELIVFITPRLLEEATAGQLATIPPSAAGPREQEAPGARQETIEQTLNALEKKPAL